MLAPRPTDRGFARAAGNPGVVGPGMLTAACVGKCVTDYGGSENLRRFKVRFATRVWPGDSITCKGKATKKYEHNGEKRIDGEVRALNQKGEGAVSGTFSAARPTRNSAARSRSSPAAGAAPGRPSPSAS